jgi:hypothetical protein
MPRPTSTWKVLERFVAKYLGAERTHWSREDARTDTFSIEVKHGKQIPKFIQKAWAQAKRNTDTTRTPLLVLHWPGLRRNRSLVVLELKDFREILNGKTSQDS